MNSKVVVVVVLYRKIYFNLTMIKCLQNLSTQSFKSYTLIQLNPSHKKDQAKNKRLINDIYTFKLNFVPIIIIIYSTTTSQCDTLDIEQKARIQLKKYGIKRIVCDRTINYITTMTITYMVYNFFKQFYIFY
ncbi:unnamed protein product [Vicia faba]|uniref:Uncharacterized protein n=1 Tax=Vicia faba TaxID=3906 RepID=A0AAV1AE65_VICFA|nr:unnamed protein product [Vicia faba]